MRLVLRGVYDADGVEGGCQSTAERSRETRTEQNAVELVRILVDVGEQDAAGLQHCEKLSLSWRGKRGQERVGTLVNTQLQCCCVVRDGIHRLHISKPVEAQLYRMLSSTFHTMH
jgi:hypothetical protein